MNDEATAGVFLDERRVGTLGYSDGNTWFTYEDREPGHPVLGQAFESDPTRRRNASGSVPEWFSNLLPERGSGLRDLIGRELGLREAHDFQIVCHIGNDLPGAVRVVADSDIDEIDSPQPVGDEYGHEHPVRFSLAGIQAKFSMVWEGKSLVLPMSGDGGNWIVKLPDRRFPEVPANEYTIMQWIGLSGIDVPQTRLVVGRDLSGLPEGLVNEDNVAFAIERFDRRDGNRVHQEDFAQVRETSVAAKYDRASYSGIARVINLLCPQDVEQYLRRLAAMVVVGNLDAHLKNWSLRYPDTRTPRLSPAYDFVCVSAYSHVEKGFRDEQLAFAINGGRSARLATLKHFRNLAHRAQLEGEFVVNVISETVTRLLETWPSVKGMDSSPKFVADHIDGRLSSLPLIREV